jgi:antitoxin MazE
LNKGVINMLATIQKWGNSQAVRLPKAILEMAGIQENDRVEIKVQDGKVVIIPAKKHKTLAERIAEYQGDYQCREWDTGKPVGRED